MDQWTDTAIVSGLPTGVPSVYNKFTAGQRIKNIKFFYRNKTNQIGQFTVYFYTPENFYPLGPHIRQYVQNSFVVLEHPAELTMNKDDYFSYSSFASNGDSLEYRIQYEVCD